MASRSDMSDLLAILAECDDSEITSSSCTSVGHAIASPLSGSADCSLEIDSSEIETLFCQCDNEDALVECLSCRSLFKLDTFCPGC
jgi:hypothetical protein